VNLFCKVAIAMTSRFHSPIDNQQHYTSSFEIRSTVFESWEYPNRVTIEEVLVEKDEEDDNIVAIEQDRHENALRKGYTR
jgi:phage baseplate assembly protein W